MESFKIQTEINNEPKPARKRVIPRTPLTQREIVSAFGNNPEFPPLLTLEKAAKLAQLAPSTIKRLVSEGFFCDSVRRGKPVAFWRDRFVREVMDLDRARKRKRNSQAQKQIGGDY